MVLCVKVLMALVLMIFIHGGSLTAAAEPAAPGKVLPPIPLSLYEVLSWVDRAHPVL